MKEKIEIFLVFLFVFHLGVKAQINLDSAKAEVSLYGSLATNYQPFWFGANRDGVIAENLQNVVVTSELYLPYVMNDNWTFEAGAQVVVRNSGSSSYSFSQSIGLFLNEYFLNTSYKSLSLNIGAFPDRHSIIFHELSSGDWAASRNARPIPKISLGFDDYVGVPFSREWVKVKGIFAQGWMERERFVPKPQLHEKSAYIKILEPWLVSFEFGMSHFALYGGDSDSADTSVSWKDYLNIVAGKEAAGVASGGYVPGSHLGTLDFVMNFTLGKRPVKVYIQKPWEDSQQIGKQKFFKKYTDNADQLVGLHISNPGKKKWLKNLVIEYMHSKLQTGPGLSDVPGGGNPGDLDPDGTLFNQGYAYGQRENYYNNWFYGSGWTRYGRTIGTPLFLTSARIRDVYGDVEFGLDYERTFVFNNRIEGLHIGANGRISSKTDYELKFTYTRNFGNYYSQYGRYWERLDQDYYFESGRTHYYLATSVNHELRGPLEIHVSLGYDFGEQNNSFGLLSKVTYRFKE
ncbi:MAG: capsule assembly Wzi family protein [Cyclobacteriaceae bacterium]